MPTTGAGKSNCRRPQPPRPRPGDAPRRVSRGPRRLLSPGCNRTSHPELEATGQRCSDRTAGRRVAQGHRRMGGQVRIHTRLRTPFAWFAALALTAAVVTAATGSAGGASALGGGRAEDAGRCDHRLRRAAHGAGRAPLPAARGRTTRSPCMPPRRRAGDSTSRRKLAPDQPGRRPRATRPRRTRATGSHPVREIMTYVPDLSIAKSKHRDLDQHRLVARRERADRHPRHRRRTRACRTSPSSTRRRRTKTQQTAAHPSGASR